LSTLLLIHLGALLERAVLSFMNSVTGSGL
jgi:hypothetical protein